MTTSRAAGSAQPMPWRWPEFARRSVRVTSTVSSGPTAGALRNGARSPTSSPGDVATFDFGGGDHHVSIIDHVEGDMYVCIGRKPEPHGEAVDVPQGSVHRNQNTNKLKKV